MSWKFVCRICGRDAQRVVGGWKCDHETDSDETLRWIATTLVNDEESSNQELQEHFESNDVSTEAARFYISQRNDALKHGLTFKLKPYAP